PVLQAAADQRKIDKIVHRASTLHNVHGLQTKPSGLGGGFNLDDVRRASPRSAVRYVRYVR
ncbi:MAG: hypothetical protein ABI175_23265, partial [Polyangiales bacterium]